MTGHRRRQIQLLLIVRRAERDTLLTAPSRQARDRRGGSAAGTHVRMLGDAAA
jgi:hypothetical protein